MDSRLRATLFAVVVAVSVVVPLGGSSQAATIQVTTRADELNDDGDCSLREALVSVNTLTVEDACADPEPQGNTIQLQSGEYNLSRAGQNENDGETGDLDIARAGTTLKGKGMSATTIDGGDLDRVIDVAGPAGNSTIADLSVVNGQVTSPASEGYDGGGIQNSADPLFVKRVFVSRNEATGASNFDEVGGGIVNFGRLIMVDSQLHDNEASRGGGLFNTGGAYLTMRRSSVTDNHASSPAYGGGLVIFGVENLLENVTVSGNSTVESNTGGGIHLGSEQPLTIRHSTIAANTPGNIYVAGDLTASSSIIADPIGGQNCVIETIGDAEGEAQNIDEDGTCFNNTDFEGDPGLRPLNDNGGFALTHALKGSSTARNASLEDCVPTDARGAPRPQAGCNAATTNDQDLGAYELVRCDGSVVDTVGTPKPDTIHGSKGADVVLALGGNDIVRTSIADDTVCGGGGKDVLKGEGDEDRLLGQDGADKLNGGNSHDACIGGPGNDTATNCEVRKGL